MTVTPEQYIANRLAEEQPVVPRRPFAKSDDGLSPCSFN